jgi:glycosyltransferase involved in cell wall biosynthesis
MPVRNEVAFIGRSLSAVLAQDYPSDRMEVIVAEAMSSDGTRQIIERMIKQRKGVAFVCIVDNVDQIVAKGFNRALRISRGDIIVRVDGHAEIAPDYVRQCVTLLQTSGATNVGGRMDPVGGGNFGDAVALATSSPFGVGPARFHYSTKEEQVDTVYLGAWPRYAFDRYGTLDEELVRNQDDEFNYRLRKFGGRILLSPLIRSQYFNRTGFRRLWKQYFEYGMWKVRVLQKHPRQMSYRQFVPPAFVALILGLGAMSLLTSIGRPALFTLVAIYLAADVVASLLAAWPNQLALIPVLAIVYPALHVGYGLGFLCGIVRFFGGWLKPEKRKSPNSAGS